MSDHSFTHSGALGDALYSLAAVRAVGGGSFHLKPKLSPNLHPIADRGRLEIDQLAAISNLVAHQSYITGVDPEPNPDAFDLDRFRNHLWGHRPMLYQAHFLALRLPACEYQPWLDWPQVKPAGTVVINRTLRYRGDLNWNAVLEDDDRPRCFIGTPEEHADWEATVGPIEYRPTPDLAAAAQIIATAAVFYGNASSCWVIAQGLGVNRRMETTAETRYTATFSDAEVL